MEATQVHHVLGVVQCLGFITFGMFHTYTYHTMAGVNVTAVDVQKRHLASGFNEFRSISSMCY
eukprot:1161948-Pelagomonas_calceolata.AAC.6